MSPTLLSFFSCHFFFLFHWSMMDFVKRLGLEDRSANHQKAVQFLMRELQ